MKTIKNILYLVKPYWQYGRLYLLGRIALPVAVAPALALADVRLMQAVLDAIDAGAALRSTLAVAGALVGIKLGLTMLRWSFLLLYDRWKAVDMRNKINRGIYAQAVATDYKYFDNPEFYNDFTFAVGELAAKSEDALGLLTEILALVSVIAAMAAYLSALGPWVIVISVAGQLICLLAQLRIQKYGIARTAESLPFDRGLQYVHRLAYQKQYAADMKSTGLPGLVLAMFDRSGEGKVGVFKKYAWPHWRANMLMFAAWHLCELAQLAWLIYCVFTQGLGAGAVAGMFAAAVKLNHQFNSFVGVSAKAVEASLYADKVRAFFEHPSEIEQKKGGAEPPEGPFALELREVSFAYPGAGFALKNISMTIKPGEKIAIAGENGAGKSTLAKLLLCLYDADEGEILYNGVPVGDYDVHGLRRKIGVAFQDPQVYALTVRENMELYNRDDDGTLRDVLRRAGLELDLDSQVTREFDGGGAVLSGGQAQKLGLTRLLHGAFGLLLLDEPSSALDSLAEYQMTRLIFGQSNTTTVMVAHRLSTVRGADRIYLVDGGCIAECGTHGELMALGGKYAEMFNRQAEEYVRAG